MGMDSDELRRKGMRLICCRPGDCLREGILS